MSRRRKNSEEVGILSEETGITPQTGNYFIGDLVKQVSQMNESLNKLIELQTNTQKLDQLVPIQSQELRPTTQQGILQSSPSASVAQSSLIPIPIEYRQLVDNTLNRTFGIDIRPRSDVPAFEFVINVPKRYSNAPAAHWDMYKSDERMRVISYADGVNGVRDWCERVFNNFNQDTKAMIIQDRVNS